MDKLDKEQRALNAIQILPPSGPFDLYQWHEITVTTYDPLTNWNIFLTTGPEDPAPVDGQLGHTFMFDSQSVQPSTESQPFKSTINIMAVGPNTDTKVTVYAWALNDSPIGSVELQFRAVENPPKSTIGLFSVEGPDLQARVGPPNLVSAAYMDAKGAPLEGQIEWNYGGDAYGPFAILSSQTQTADDGTATNGFVGVQGRAITFISATTPDGAAAKLWMWFQSRNVPSPTIAITADTPPKHFTATHPSAPDGTEVLWVAYPAEKVQFAERTTLISNGSTGVDFTYSSDEPFTAYISASLLNPATKQRDFGNLELALQKRGSGTVVVTSDETPPLSLYEPHWLEAKFTGDNEQAITEYIWSVDPLSDLDHVFQFNPNPSQRDNAGKFRTQITAYGANKDTLVTVNARAVGLDDSKPHVGSLNLPFKKVETPPATKFIKVDSADGNPLSTGKWHLVRALCTTASGDPLYPQSVTWNISSPDIKLASADPTPTNKYGIATNLICAADPIIGNVGAWLTDDNSVIDVMQGVIFEAGDVSLPGAGTMTFVPPLESPLTLGDPHEINVQYLDSNKAPMPQGTPIEWSAYPSDKLTFERPITQVEDDQGNSSNTITGLGTDDIPTVVINTRSYNNKTKEFDHGDVTTSFQHTTEPTVALFGVMLDKAYCKNPGRNQKVDPRKPAQVIKCQVQVLGAQGAQKVSFPLNPGGEAPAAPPMIYDAKTYALLDQENGAYYAMTDSGNPPTATVLVGCRQPAIFTLGTAWQPQDRQPAACLTIATNSAETNIFYDAPTIQPPLVNGNLQLPTSTQWPAPTFKAFLPASSTLAPDDQIAFLINDQLVYNGPAKPALNGAVTKGPGVDLAYASLLTDGSMNNLVYVVAGYSTSGVSSPLSFPASGTPQTDPAGPSPSLPAPEVDGSPSSIGPDAIVSWLNKSGSLTGGLPVKIGPKAKVGDTIILYFYLSGTDALTGSPISNVVPVTYNVNAGDPLTSGDTAIVYLPQWAAAGYSNGTLQIDYRLQSLSGTNWSVPSPIYKLNTTF